MGNKVDLIARSTRQAPHLAFALACLLLAGCASNAAPVTPSRRLVGPADWAMRPAQPLPDPKVGEDAKALLGQCRAAHGEETAKLEPLQGFVRRVTGKKD